MKHVIFGLAAAFFVAQAGLAETTIGTATGPLTLDGTPQSLASYDVAAIDTLSALGIEVAGVPSQLFVTYLDDVKSGAAVVGTLFEPEYEALAKLVPELSRMALKFWN